MVGYFRERNVKPDYAPTSHRRKRITTLVLVLALCLMDPQGAYLAIACLVTMAAMVGGPDRRLARLVLSALTAGVVVYFIWYWVLAPQLIRQINRFEVSFSYPRARWRLLFASTWQFLLSFYLAEGVTLTLDTIRFYIGNIPRALAAAVLAFALYVYQQTGLALRSLLGCQWLPEIRAGAIAVMVWFGFAVILNTLMVSQHPLLYLEDFRRTGPHRIPNALLALLGLTFFAYRLQTSGLLSKGAMRVLLLTLFISNIFAIPAHYAIDRNGWFKSYQEATPLMVDALKELVALPHN